MVNGRQTRNLPGRKTDMADSQWGATPHMHGLLRAGFVPPTDIRQLQDYLRLRADHVGSAAARVQLMQKAFDRMNIKLHDVISSLTGVSGLAVARVIVADERPPGVLVAFCDIQSVEKRNRPSSNPYVAPRPTSTSSRQAKHCNPETLPETHRRLRQAHHCGTGITR